MLNKSNQAYYDVIGLEHRPYESSFSKAVLSSSVISRYPFFMSLLLSAPISKILQNRPCSPR
ncbi:hypothetical protein D4100_21535 [Serratia inhibens]|uniref:Uncharacterized protein n=1 Tax=Serratia inhibens TaxID=2338073 RepID=A0AA92X2A4_9GAMM|nr:hypothetical protein D4100_21535 [Serratia inhibens]